MISRYCAFLLLSSLMISGAAFAQISDNLNQLSEWMTGDFDSSEQAKNDTAYADISLKMTRIWSDKSNGIWLYVEQAASKSLDEPYRQRVYFLSDVNENEISSDVYEFKDPAPFVGAWNDPSKFSDITPFDLTYKDGCTVFLFYDGFQFSGSTNESSCKSTLRGAAYTTSEVIILPNTIKSWDRGFNEEGEQVWGAEAGHYIFKK
ncbi:MAG: chromophore lyase CpcT/CpeT [Cryomorphaceae bacterium]|nr:chromophore lyase CpcT/CpeT [Flavobacteriales bacterium]